MKTLVAASLLLFLFAQSAHSQTDSLKTYYKNAASEMMIKDSKLTVGGYAQLDYNQPIEGGIRNNGKLDVHRLVMLFGYKFNSKAQFITEIEFEHVKEVYVEQAFISYRFKPSIEFRGGLILIPMGIVNEYHEPTTFNGVERPLIDKYISTSTWRELGAGLTGHFPFSSIRYQAYIVNGFKGYDEGDALLGGKNGLRGGRQKGAESTISSPNFTGKIEYYGILGLNVGLSAYIGKTQSTLYDGLDKTNDPAMKSADSSTVGIKMFGIDTRYNNAGFKAKGQLYYVNINNTEQYNAFTGADLGSKMYGYYAEIAYDVLNNIDKVNTELSPFIRYESFDTHAQISGEITDNEAYNRKMITAGITCKPNKGIAFKADYQWLKSQAANEGSNTVNLGIGIWF